MLFELFTLMLFVWLFVGAIRLAFKVTWGLAKVAAVILFVLSIPMLLGCLLLASGFILLLPVALVGIAFAILNAAI